MQLIAMHKQLWCLVDSSIVVIWLFWFCAWVGPWTRHDIRSSAPHTRTRNTRNRPDWRLSFGRGLIAECRRWWLFGYLNNTVEKQLVWYVDHCECCMQRIARCARGKPQSIIHNHDKLRRQWHTSCKHRQYKRARARSVWTRTNCVDTRTEYDAHGPGRHIDDHYYYQRLQCALLVLFGHWVGRAAESCATSNRAQNVQFCQSGNIFQSKYLNSKNL